MMREQVSNSRGKSSEPEKGNLYLLTGIVIGILLGLVIAWLIAPVKYINTVPSSLRNDFKDDQRILIANAYLETNNLPRAEARILLLGDPDPIQALTTQAQALLAVGDPSGKAYILANLVDSLKKSSTFLSDFISLTDVGSSDSTNTDVFSQVTTTFPTLIIDQADSPTLQIATTPQTTHVGSFVQKSNQVICDSQKASLLLMVEVYNSTGDPIPGIELIITWPMGEEKFYTGFQPEKGLGYADYLMVPNTVYGIRIGGSEFSISNLTAPTCSVKNGKTIWGGLKLILQKP